jgi:hypothetical protein
MKKQIPNGAATRNKLKLGRETLRVLHAPELLRVIGGDTRWTCTTTTNNSGDDPHG